MTITVQTLLAKYNQGPNDFLRYIDKLNKKYKSDDERKNIRENLREVLKQRPQSDYLLMKYILNQAPDNFKDFEYFARIMLGENKSHILSNFFDPIRLYSPINFFGGKRTILKDLEIALYIFGARAKSLTEKEKKEAITSKNDLTSFICTLPPKKDKLAINLITIAMNNTTPLGEIFDAQRGFTEVSLFSNEKSCLSYLKQNLAERSERIATVQAFTEQDKIEYEKSCQAYEEKNREKKLIAKEVGQEQASTDSMFYYNKQNSKDPVYSIGYKKKSERPVYSIFYNRQNSAKPPAVSKLSEFVNRKQFR